METGNRRMMIPNVGVVSRSVGAGFKVTFRAGLKLGVVLFVALTTFSVLDRSTVYLGDALKGYLKPSKETTRNLVIPRRGEGFASVHPVRPVTPARQGEDPRLMMRASSQFLNEFDRLARAFVRVVR